MRYSRMDLLRGRELTRTDLYYDPYDLEIDADPYPTYRRLRDEAPLYYNELYDFWGLSRCADVIDALRDVQTTELCQGGHPRSG